MSIWVKMPWIVLIGVRAVSWADTHLDQRKLMNSKIRLLVTIAAAFGLFSPNRLGFAGAALGADDANIPVPPEQSLPWTSPPTKLSPAAVSAITEIFNEGLADPRGCEYREIAVKAGIELNIKTHGWILPGTGESRFAVGWNGLVYPVATMGPPASLQKDVADQAAKDQKQWGSYTGTNRDVRGNWPVAEWVSVSHDNLLPLKVAMLLRLGRADLAESVWNRWFALATNGIDDPYLLLAREWTESLYNRALYAHLRGDDAVSLADCRTLVPLRSTVEATAARRGFAREPAGKPYLEDLEELPKLAADQERRAQEPPSIPVLQSGQPAQGPERIAALIRDLELVAARQEMNPGQTDVSTDPIVGALIKEGDPAVEPLLKCFEEDTRLTRSEFTQGMQIRPGLIIPVYEPAFAAIAGILKTPFYFSDSDNRTSDVFRQPSDPRDRQPRDLSVADRKFLAGKIRAYWDRYKSVTLADRWYATLQDDNAGVDAWFLAVDNIVQPTNISTTPRTMFGGGEWSGGGFPQNAPVVLQGESLRAKANPSVSDLIIKRFKEAVAQSASDKTISFIPVGKLILALADWDGKAHLADLREMGQDFHARFPHERAPFASTVQTETALYKKRADLGDPRALQDYADWLTALALEDFSIVSPTLPFQVMWEHPTEPVIQRAAEKMFAAENSPWGHLTSRNNCALADLLSSPLIGLAAFRREVDRELTDGALIGKVKMGDNGSVDIARDDSTSQEPNLSSRFDPLAPPIGSQISFRTCDYCAFRLSKLDGFPACQLYWPRPRLNQAVAACRKFLRQYGDAYQWNGEPFEIGFYGCTPRVHFPKLGHPATSDDVKQGRAIFSLPGTTRLCPLPDFPIGAWRPDRKTDPSEASETTADGTSKIIIMYTTEGRVWQAEETLVNGKWERYYGFVGRYQLEKVPAAEISFSYQGADGNVTKEINGTIEGPQDYVQDPPNFSSVTHDFAQLDSLLPVKVKISNGSGLDQVVPAALMLPPGAKKALPPGISLTLLYSEKLPPKVSSFSEPPFNYGLWQDVPLRKEVQIKASAAPGPALVPTQDFTVLDIDLRDFFDMSRPGTYRVQSVFHMPGQPVSKSNEVRFSVALALRNATR